MLNLLIVSGTHEERIIYPVCRRHQDNMTLNLWFLMVMYLSGYRRIVAQGIPVFLIY